MLNKSNFITHTYFRQEMEFQYEVVSEGSDKKKLYHSTITLFHKIHDG